MNFPIDEHNDIVRRVSSAATPEFLESHDRPGRPFAFRFVVRFGPQLSTPCSRSLEIGPQTRPAHPSPSASLFQHHLRCHTFAR